MKTRPNPTSRPAEDLCLSCGLCCNGVIFCDGQLQPDDHLERLKRLGLRFRQGAARGKVVSLRACQKFLQPCAAYQGGCCTIYPERPLYCRAFECLLLKSVKDGRAGMPAARRIIRKTLKQAARVDSLLRKLGDEDESLALSKRFRRTSRRLESGHYDQNVSGFYGELTMAVFELNRLLSEHFYR